MNVFRIFENIKFNTNVVRSLLFFTSVEETQNFGSTMSNAKSRVSNIAIGVDDCDREILEIGVVRGLDITARIIELKKSELTSLTILTIRKGGGITSRRS